MAQKNLTSRCNVKGTVYSDSVTTTVTAGIQNFISSEKSANFPCFEIIRCNENVLT